MKRTRLNSILLLSAVMIALPLFMAPANATIPVEIERVKDEYFFKIHGHPSSEPWGKVNFIYKNLSTQPQKVAMEFRYTWYGPRKMNIPPQNLYIILLPGEEISNEFDADTNTLVYFDLTIGDLELDDHVIRIPP